MAKKKSARAERMEKVRTIARDLLSDPDYVDNLKGRLKTGELKPQVEVALWHYAHGKPAETVKLEDHRSWTDEQLNQAILDKIANSHSGSKV